MTGQLSRRLLELPVAVFALLGFFYVPLGRHTGFEHARAILSTAPARAAFSELTEATLAIRHKVAMLFAPTDAEAREARPSTAKAPGAERGPRPVPPRLR